MHRDHKDKDIEDSDENSYFEIFTNFEHNISKIKIYPFQTLGEILALWNEHKVTLIKLSEFEMPKSEENLPIFYSIELKESRINDVKIFNGTLYILSYSNELYTSNLNSKPETP